MANKDNIPEPIPEFTLEDIMREFGSGELDLDAPADSLGDTQVFTPITEAELQAHKNTAETAEASEAETELSAAVDVPTEGEASADLEIPDEEGPSDDMEIPVADVPSDDAEIPVADVPSDDAEIPAEDESSDDAEIPAEDESSDDMEIPVADVPSDDAEIPAENEPSDDAEIPTEDEPSEEAVPTADLAATQVFTPVTLEALLAEPEAPTGEAVEEEAPAEERAEAPTEEETAEAPAEEAAEKAEEAESDIPEETYTLTAEQIPQPKAIPFRSRLSDLKRKLVAGPEKRYYDLTEMGLGRLQITIFLNLLIVVLCTGGTALYAIGAVMENRLRLMIFSQILAMMVSALLGCYVLMDGILDLFTGKFSLNTMLFLTLAACAADAVFCLRELRVPCCAAFSLEMTFALWNRSLRRSTEMGQMDTLRKATRLDALVKVKGYFADEDGIVRTEGRVEDFMDNYNTATASEKVLNIYALVSVLACAGIAVLAGIRHGLSLAVQVFSTSMLVAVPAGAFISQSRPAAILERRLHMVGTVLCGWQGVRTLCGKASFPLSDRDLFPLGSIKLNGVKFLGDAEPDSVIASAAALMRANGGGLDPVFTQLLKSRNGAFLTTEAVQSFPNGISGEIQGSRCLLGLRECLEEQGIEIPENARVNQAVYFAMDGQLAAVFALNYARTRAAAGGLVTLGSCRKIRPMVLCGNFMVNDQLLKEKFGIKPKRYDFPDRELRDDLSAFQPDPELIAGALTTQQHLSSAAYAVSGARALRTASRIGTGIHIFAGVVGLLIMSALAYLGDMQLLSPFNILLYQLVWLIPGLLFTEWTRTV